MIPSNKEIDTTNPCMVETKDETTIKRTRDVSIDIIKGMAILFVYLGHSILYHPIQMEHLYPWCRFLGIFIYSFNMPLFFIVSGYLFSNSKKGTKELYEGKIKRLAIPYLFTMAILIGMKLVLPSSMSYNSAVGGGIKSLIINALVYGGDRWFVYELFIMYVLLIPVRGVIKNRWILLLMAIILIGVFYLGIMPKVFMLSQLFYYMIFFLAGFAIHQNWEVIKRLCKKYWWLTYGVFALVNMVYVRPLSNVSFVFLFLLPFSGYLACMAAAAQLENSKSKIVKYIEYCGKYSLQLYLFSFCYPLIRWGIVSVLHITNPVVILLSVFVLQLITITIIVEITRRIKFLKIPCGY